MNLTEEEIQFCQKIFSQYDEEGQGCIYIQDLKFALENIGCQLIESEIFKIISEIDEKNTGLIKFSDFLSIYQKLKNKSQEQDDQDTLDAFVAMGGNADKSGFVDSNMLIRTIKEEFQLTIDIEGLIKEVDQDNSGKIEFEEFKTLLQSAFAGQSE